MQYHEDDIFAYVAKELLVAVDDETVISGNSTSNNTQEATSSTQGSNSSNTKRTDLFNKVKHAHRLLWLVALVAMTLALQAWLIHIVAQGGLTKLQLDDGVYDARDELQKARSKIPIAADLAAAKWPKQLQDSLKRLNSTAKCGEYPTKQQLKNVSNALSNEENVMMMKEMNEPPSNNITNIGNRTERQRNLVVDHVMREKQLKSLNTAVDLFSKSVKSANNYNRTQLAAALSLVAVAVSVKRELMRSMLLARIVTSHIGCLPEFFSPLYMQPQHSSLKTLLPFPTIIILLMLPVGQLSVCLTVLYAAVTAIAHDVHAGNVVSVVLNSVALLFVLEIDNAISTILKESDALRRMNLSYVVHSRRKAAANPESAAAGYTSAWLMKQQEVILTFQKPQSVFPDPTCISRFLGHVYVLLIGFAWLFVPFATGLPAIMGVNASSSSQPLEKLVTVLPLSPQAAQAAAVLYMAFAVLLFEPAFLPSSHGRAWRWMHKVCIVACAGTMCSAILASSQIHRYRRELQQGCECSPNIGNWKQQFLWEVISSTFYDLSYLLAFCLPFLCAVAMYIVWPRVVVETAADKTTSQDSLNNAEHTMVNWSSVV
jgi:hypothetical protein